MNLLKISSLILAAAAVSQASADYKIVAKWPVPGKTTRYDYVRVDPENRRLYVANDKNFDVLDVDSGKPVGKVGPSSRAHGVALVPELNRGFASFGDTNSVVEFDLKTLQTIATIPSQGKNPDSIEYDSDTKRVYAVNGASGNVAVIDPSAGKVVALVALTEGKLEQIGFDGHGHAFVNNEEKSTIHVFDTHTLKALDTWSLAPGEGGTGLVVDGAHHRTMSACGNNKLVVLDSESGKVVATPAIGEDPDGAYLDAKSGKVFTSNNDGTLSVLHQDSPDSYSEVQTLQTGTGARTIAFDPQTGRIFVPTARFGPKPAPTKDVPEPRAPMVPGSLSVIVIGE